jgi:eukaryotic-like serine/threonine-protein kinase
MSADGDRGAGRASDPDSLSATQAEELDRACDRFEAAWRAGPRPRLEDHLKGITEPLRSAWLGALIAVELDWRRRRGERPGPAEYHDRYPGHAEAVAAGFGPAAGPARPRAVPARSDDLAPGLLLGLLAFQNHFIDREALLAALGAWVADKATPLGRVLVARGALDAATHALLEALAKKHLEVHDGDAEKSLAALAIGASTREVLARVGDPEIQATLSHIGSGSSPAEPDAESTASYRVGSATGEGQRFRVLRPHAKGGLGAVYVALDTELHREVALKQILESHADDETSRSRFLLEAEITGGLEHPGIVPVYGLGTYGDGRPYYAMRFIRGDSLKEAIEHFHAEAALKADPGRRTLELRKLLRRFTDICNAIDYAHSRGVLHRDIKPGNIIVGKYGETLVVDWGLAKAMGKSDPGSGERTLRPSSGSGSAETLPGSALGTPAYMSPEQADGDLEHLGPRSDVYSLGATLYCLLTGRAPFTDGSIDTVLRSVRRGNFRPPRQVDPAIDRALEAICLKAVALKPEDRYGSCRALTEDIERWMADEPVSAWREPLSIRARRSVRRHRTLVTSTTAVLALGLAGLAGFATVVTGKNRELDAKNLQLVGKNHELDRQRQAAEDERNRAVRAEQAARDEEAKTKKSEGETKAVLEFFQTKVLAAARPKDQDGGLGKDVSLREAVDAAESGIEKSFANQPTVEASIRSTLGQSYSYLGELVLAIRQQDHAVALLRQTLGPDHPDTLAAMTNLADTYSNAGRLAEALSLHEETLKKLKVKLGPDHPRTLAAMSSLANSYGAAGRLAEAVSLHEEELKRSRARSDPDHPETLASMYNLAVSYWMAGRFDDALSLHAETLKRRKARLGPGHPETLYSMNDLALAYWDTGRLAEALPLLEEALEASKLTLGPNHPFTLTVMHNLAGAYLDCGRLGDALPLFRETVERRRVKLGPDHPLTLISSSDLASAYREGGRLAEAIALFEETLHRRQAKLGLDHPSTLDSMHKLATAYHDAGRLAEAVSLHEKTLKGLKAKLGTDHPLTLYSMYNLASSFNDAGRLAEAESLLRAALSIREQKTPDNWLTFNTRSLLGATLLGQKRFAEAEPLIVSGYEGMKAHEEKIPPRLRPRLSEAAHRVVRLYEGWGKPDQAAAWKAKLGMSDLPADVFARP